MDTDPKSQSKTPPPKHRFSLREFELLYHRLDPTNNGIRSAALAGYSCRSWLGHLRLLSISHRRFGLGRQKRVLIPLTGGGKGVQV